MLTLAFDTATNIATTALLEDGEVLGERTGLPGRLLEDVDQLLTSAVAAPGELERIVVGTGPGSFTGLRMGLAAARGLAFALDISVAGVSTLAAIAEGAPGALPVIDAGRREVFTLVDGRPTVCSPHEVVAELCVGDGALRYRRVLEERGVTVPPDDDERHLPRARFHAALAGSFGPADAVEPLYLRIPDAERQA